MARLYHWAMSIFDFCITNVIKPCQNEAACTNFARHTNELTHSLARLIVHIVSHSATLCFSLTFYAYFANQTHWNFPFGRILSIIAHSERETNCIMYAMNIICSHLISLGVRIHCIQISTQIDSIRLKRNHFIYNFFSFSLSLSLLLCHCSVLFFFALLLCILFSSCVFLSSFKNFGICFKSVYVCTQRVHMFRIDIGSWTLLRANRSFPWIVGFVDKE